MPPPPRHIKKTRKRKCTELISITEAVQTGESEHKIAKMEQIQHSDNESDGANLNSRNRNGQYGIDHKVAPYSDYEVAQYELMQRKIMQSYQYRVVRPDIGGK